MPDPLDIKVQVTGAQQAAQQLDGVTNAATRAAEETAKVSTTTTPEQRAQAQEALKQIELDERAAKSKKQLDDATKSATKSLQNAQKASQGAADAVGGLAQASQGGVTGVLGLGRALNGLRNLVEGLGSSLAKFAAPAAVAFGLVGGAVLALSAKARANRREMELMFEAQEKRAKALKSAMAELEAQSQRSIEAQRVAVERLVKSYDDLIGRMDRASTRASAITGAELTLERARIDQGEQEALAGAKTPEEADRIRRNAEAERAILEVRAKSAELETQNLNAQNRINETEQALIDRRGAIADAELALVQAQKAQADALAAVRDLPAARDSRGRPVDNNDPAAVATRDQAKLAAEQLAQAEKVLADAVSSLDSFTANAEQQIAAARQTLEVNRILAEALKVQAETQAARQTASAVAAGAETQARAEEQKQAARDANASGDFGGQDQAVKEAKRLQKEVTTAIADTADQGAKLVEAAKVPESNLVPVEQALGRMGTAFVGRVDAEAKQRQKDIQDLTRRIDALATQVRNVKAANTQ